MKSRSRPAKGRAAGLRVEGASVHAGNVGATPEKTRAPWRYPALWSALAGVALFLPALEYGFVWDDIPLIAHNPLLRGHGTLGQLLLSDFWSASGQHTGFWRPLAVSSTGRRRDSTP